MTQQWHSKLFPLLCTARGIGEQMSTLYCPENPVRIWCVLIQSLKSAPSGCKVTQCSKQF